ncbi:transglutaminase-like domain-containing protein [Actinophytocola gossypii]|uniref:Transglutaminase domain-containing protein n=1 Tax=Actinophytocola gossypii TaxID=2812003 RepID=A0ABT2J749_9PSEU|nr:transglutaminase-like domain-containing protein [Actinophytocola gossypii]MCT2583679.1 transglutaminase domain-containing protein [Actinophytocola gossypii]
MQTLPRYTKQIGFTSAGGHAALFEGLPNDVAELCSVTQGLLIHEHLAGSYGVTLDEDDRRSAHLRRVAELLDWIVDRDPRPLDVAREPAARTAGNCRQFTVLLVSMLRAQDVPARARCGFGTYFGSSLGEDHWVAEVWLDGRWRLVDAQVDEHQRALFGVDLDLTDVPRDRFLVAGDAWAACRSGEADPATFGLSVTGETGAWWIAGNLMRDVAALNNAEMLPWDVWGAMPGPDDVIDEDRVALFDELAALTAEPDGHLDELRARFESDDRLRVGPVVHNVLRSRNEEVSLGLTR